ncbi:MAG: LiaI-LiaF-like domain-containing protein [Coriobacteriia bacterium]
MELKRAAEGLTLVAVGVLLLANMLGYVPWSVWWNILSLWPLLLISAGLDVIGRGTENTWLRVLSSLLVIGGLAYGVFAMPVNGGWARVPFAISINQADTEPFEFSEPHDAGVETGTALVKGGVGTLTVKAGSVLASSEGKSPFTPDFEVSASGDTADVVMTMGDGPWVAPSPVSGLRIDTTLDRRVAWDLTIDSGVSEIDADLSELTLTELDVKTGVSQGTITLGEVDSALVDGGLPVFVDTGISSVTIRFKKGEDVRLKVTGGLSSVKVGSDMSQVDRDGDDKVYESDGFSDGAFWDVRVDAGISDVKIEFY